MSTLEDDRYSPREIYTVERISQHMEETPEGFLLCKDVPITRAGDFYYSKDETSVSPDSNGLVKMIRTIQEITRPETIASFENKPITMLHPTEDVTPENFSDLVVGTMHNVRQGEGNDIDKLLADLLIMEKEAIEAVRKNLLREVSIGCSLTEIEIAPGVGLQENLIGNHLALVPEGRAGHDFAIKDNKLLGESKKMSLKDKILKAFGASLDEALSDERKMAVRHDKKRKDEDMDEDEENDSRDGAAFVKLNNKMKKLEDSIEKMHEMMDRMHKDKKKDARDYDEDEEEEDEEDEEEDEDVEENDREQEGKDRKKKDKREKDKKKDRKEKDKREKDCSKDSSVRSKAEILAPGIDMYGNVKRRALRASYKTTDGKKIIDSLLGGKEFDDADEDLLFNGAAEMMKFKRKGKFDASVRDSEFNPQPVGGKVRLSDDINKINKEHYKRGQ